MGKKDKTKKSKKSIVSLDFTGVEKRKVLPEGEYPLDLISLEQNESANGDDQLEATFEVTGGQYKGAKPKAWFSLKPQSLWVLRNFLEACGVETEESQMDLDLEEIVDTAGPLIGICEKNDPDYPAKLRDFVAADGKAPAGKTDKKSKAVKEDEEEDDSEEENDDEALTSAEILEMTEEELEEVIDQFDLDVDLDDHEKLKAKRKAVAEAYADNSSEDEEEEEEKPKSKKASKKSKDEDEEDEDEDDDSDDEEEDEDDGLSAASIMKMGTKELQAIIKQHKLKIEGFDDKSTKGKRKLVIKALEKKELL
jgi:hypothetical protein